MRDVTLVFLVREGEILLGMKKRGFGAGKWNGVGGKVEPGESIAEGAAREANEEIGVSISPEDLRSHGTIEFSFNDKPEWSQRVHVFVTEKWEGEPVESEEMRPQWHAHHEIPFGEMWLDDPHWLPKILDGKRIEGEFMFNENGSEILKFEVRDVE